MNFLHILTIIVFYFVYLTYKPYLLDIAIASLMAIAFGKIHFMLSKYIKNRYILAGVVTLLLAVLIFGPILYFVIQAGKFISSIDFNEIKNIYLKAQTLLNYLPKDVAEKIKIYLTDENLQTIYQKIVPVIGTLTAKSAVFIKDAFLIIVFFFFAILYGEEILRYLRNIIPLDNKKLERLFFGTSEVMSIVFYSSLFTALLEGLLFGFIINFYGLNFLFFSVMYAFASLIPVVGGIMMWGPVSLYLYAQGNTQGAIVVALYSIIIISIIADTFIKPIIIAWIKKLFGNEIELNSMIIFFAIVAGLTSFGLWGIIIGPAITALFISILNFYSKVKKI